MNTRIIQLRELQRKIFKNKKNFELKKSKILVDINKEIKRLKIAKKVIKKEKWIE